ncbi:MAG: transglycosylase domain-containing protein, partial [Ruminococcus sp.]
MENKKTHNNKPQRRNNPAAPKKRPAQNSGKTGGGAVPINKSKKPVKKHRPAQNAKPVRKQPVSENRQRPQNPALPKKPDPSTANNTPLHSGYRKETDEEIRSKPPTGTPEYPYYKGSFAAAKVRRHPGLRNAFSIIITTILSLFLICVITGTIVATALTVYVMDFKDEVSAVTIEDMELQYNTYVYAENSKGEEICLYEVNNSSERVPVKIEDVPQHVRDAFVYAEDARFYVHDGVDYKRTFYSFVNMFLHIYDTNIGGSTITQQLVKNITGDDVQSPSRKIREIFRAMELEKNYSKDEILESYLNYIGFGGATNGIQGASLKYFGKSVSELSIAEAACLAAIPKSPEYLNPFAETQDETTGEWVNTGEDANKRRQYYVLEQMYENGAITYDEYQAAASEKLVFTNSEEYKELHPDDDDNPYLSAAATSWIVDTAIYEVAEYLEEMYNISSDEAIKRINSGGYRIYTTVDMDMQDYVEEKYKDINNLMDSTSVAYYGDPNGDGQYTIDEIEYPESSFIAMNYDGSIRAIVGSIGEKQASLCWNYATMEPRQPGST